MAYKRTNHHPPHYKLRLSTQKMCSGWARHYCGGRYVSGGVFVIGCRLNTIISDHEPSELNLLSGKLELLGIEHQAILVAIGQESADPLTVSDCVQMSLTIFSKSLLDVVDGQSLMIVSVCLL